MNDQEWLSMEETLRSLRREEADAQIYKAIRAQTLARLRRERNRQRDWMLAAAAVVMLICGVTWLVRPGTSPAKAVVATNRSLTVTAQNLLPSRDRKGAVAVNSAAGPRAKRKPKPPEPMKIQFLTDDPDIVIVWLVGEEGDL